MVTPNDILHGNTRTKTGHRHLRQSPTVGICKSDSVEGGDIKRFLERIYAERYGAALSVHYPEFLYASDHSGEILAVIGYRFVSAQPAFLQQYLDEPVEIAVARAVGKPVHRNQIVEIGSLASAGCGTAFILFGHLSRHLISSGATHAVATSTKALHRCFRVMGMNVTAIADASPDRLPDAGASWGTYYGTNPQVLTGEISKVSASLHAFGAVQERGTAMTSGRAS